MSTADQSEEARVAFSSGNAATEQPVLSAEADLTHELFAQVVVDRQVRVVQVTSQLGPVIASVVQRLAKIALR